jgi:hypothetical protein
VITEHDTIPYGTGVKRHDTNLHSARIGPYPTVTSKVPLLSLWGAEPFSVNSLGSLARIALRPFNQARTPLWAYIIGLSQPRPPCALRECQFRCASVNSVCHPFKEAATWLVPQLSTVPVASSPEADSLSDSSPELSSELSSTELMVPGEASMSEQAAAPDCPVRAPSKAGSLPSLHCVGEGAHRCAPCAPN